MAQFNIGSNKVKAFVGTGKVKKAFVGTKKVYSAGSIVTYNVDNDISYQEEVDEGASVLSPTSFTPTKSGWIFTGWREDTIASGDILSSKVMNDTPITLYAVFQADVTATTYNGSNTANTETKPKYYNNTNILGATFNLTQNAVTGWTTKQGWNTTLNNSTKSIDDGSNVTITDNTTYYSLYTNNITVTKWTGNNVSSTETKAQWGQFNGTGTVWNPSFTLTEPDLSGWSKNGWNTGANNTTATVSNGGSVTLSANATYYALYTSTITVTYYNNSTSASSTTGTRYVRAGSAWSFTNPTFNLSQADKSGWSKRGWSTSNSGSAGITYNNATNFTRDSNVTLYGLYQQTITVTYYNNSSSAASTSGTRYWAPAGAINPTFKLSQASVSGWSARGWSTSSAGNASITYANATNFTRDSNCTLYASWSRTVTVSYNGNGNTGGSTAASTGTAYRGYKGDGINATIATRANGFTKTNYGFYRWRLNGTGGTAYNAGSNYVSTADCTMYAEWLVSVTNFDYTGGVQSMALKAGRKYKLEVWGAQGGSGGRQGGYGGYAVGYYTPSSDQTMYICVGGKGNEQGGGSSGYANGGYNGGGNAGGAAGGIPVTSGGGATHMSTASGLLNNSTVRSGCKIAAGGGGGYCGYSGDRTFIMGTGGGTTGGAGYEGDKLFVANGGTQSAGGGGNAGAGQGGYATDTSGWKSGGGGGWYGGAAGSRCGGGGSGYTGGVTSGSMSNGQRSGNGYARISLA